MTPDGFFVNGGMTIPLVRAAEGLGLSLPVTSENLLGLKCLHYFDVEPVIRELGIRPKNFKESLESL